MNEPDGHCGTQGTANTAGAAGWCGQVVDRTARPAAMASWIERTPTKGRHSQSAADTATAQTRSQPAILQVGRELLILEKV